MIPAAKRATAHQMDPEYDQIICGLFNANARGANLPV